MLTKQFYTKLFVYNTVVLVNSQAGRVCRTRGLIGLTVYSFAPLSTTIRLSVRQDYVLPEESIAPCIPLPWRCLAVEEDPGWSVITGVWFAAYIAIDTAVHQRFGDVRR